jgi:hypothetical protein
VCPGDEEFWIAEIDAVVLKSHAVSGVFILTPIEKVTRNDYDYITHGFYTYRDVQGIRLVYPKFDTGNWLMSIDDRRLLMQSNVHAIVIVNGHNPDIEKNVSNLPTIGVQEPGSATHGEPHD